MTILAKRLSVSLGLFPKLIFRTTGSRVKMNSTGKSHNSINNGKGKSSLNSRRLISSRVMNGSTRKKLISAGARNVVKIFFINYVCVVSRNVAAGYGLRVQISEETNPWKNEIRNAPGNSIAIHNYGFSFLTRDTRCIVMLTCKRNLRRLYGGWLQCQFLFFDWQVFLQAHKRLFYKSP